MYIGLRGSYGMRKKRYPIDDPTSYEVKQLYLNLLNKETPEDIDGVEYEFKFLTDDKAKQRDDKHYWFRVGDILKPEMLELDGLMEYLTDNEVGSDKDSRKLASKILGTLLKRITIDLTMHYYLVANSDLDSALNIFIRVNNGGTVLNRQADRFVWIQG